MLRLLCAFGSLFGHPSAEGAIRHHGQRYHHELLTCGGATVDVFVSVAYSRCVDRRGHWYSATYAGGGWGGIVAASAFTFWAKLKRGRGVEGHYTGASTSWALRRGAGLGVFTRNAGDRWWPSLGHDEYLIWVAGHRGVAADVSLLTLTITRL